MSWLISEIKTKATIKNNCPYEVQMDPCLNANITRSLNEVGQDIHFPEPWVSSTLRVRPKIPTRPAYCENNEVILW
jgi:hypothetical protein